METSKDHLKEFSLDWSPYPPESLIKKDRQPAKKHKAREMQNRKDAEAQRRR
jgi:hypothetical protein